jgi:hypothetical protein
MAKNFYVQKKHPGSNRWRLLIHIVDNSKTSTLCGKVIHRYDRWFSELPPNLTICQKCQKGTP